MYAYRMKKGNRKNKIEGPTWSPHYEGYSPDDPVFGSFTLLTIEIWGFVFHIEWNRGKTKS